MLVQSKNSPSTSKKKKKNSAIEKRPRTIFRSVYSSLSPPPRSLNSARLGQGCYFKFFHLQLTTLPATPLQIQNTQTSTQYLPLSEQETHSSRGIVRLLRGTALQHDAHWGRPRACNTSQRSPALPAPPVQDEDGNRVLLQGLIQPPRSPPAILASPALWQGAPRVCRSPHRRLRWTAGSRTPLACPTAEEGQHLC